MESPTVAYIKPVIEGLLFVSDKPIMMEQIKEAIKGAGMAEIKKALNELKDEYEGTHKGITILEIAGGYQMLSNPHYASYVREFFKTRVKEKLSRPALETLAIIAYKQPVSRADIEMIRGVNSDGVAIHLLEKGLIKVVGRKDVPGRPYLYGTSKLFLEYFGLKSLRDLPQLDDFPALAASAMVSDSETVVEDNRQGEEKGTPPADEGSVEVEKTESQSEGEEASAATATETEEALPQENVVDLKRAMEEMDKEELPPSPRRDIETGYRTEEKETEMPMGDRDNPLRDTESTIDQDITITKKDE